jgi:hypothetical protein
LAGELDTSSTPLPSADCELGGETLLTSTSAMMTGLLSGLDARRRGEKKKKKRENEKKNFEDNLFFGSSV